MLRRFQNPVGIYRLTPHRSTLVCFISSEFYGGRRESVCRRLALWDGSSIAPVRDNHGHHASVLEHDRRSDVLTEN